MTTKPLVIIESLYAGDVEANEAYLSRCLSDSLRLGEAPFASHGLYTRHGVLDDTVSEERTLGIDAGFAWAERADMTAVYCDRGVSRGMLDGILRAHKHGRFVEFRTLDTSSPDKILEHMDHIRDFLAGHNLSIKLLTDRGVAYNTGA